ncbi:hypothetical protein K493DRAFT_319739 [Basidiobolus meristosporus CBS 931.73]|uniref:CBM21 domain-containing protein n=1 Tax=Basidiobolus meristosporus CBS 931.73 TaxID=1314790 RepID=A0A1Y1XMA8_9FUNG|nr:hypothetical protein K493DRAFT_319739 [Basidiobolus meristosporus CBS 931.73]|eukprot:ORX86862.1 hypothetical protein K493DRAFT_319739 [Basidiobolus meristosporus CBS 931.73]
MTDETKPRIIEPSDNGLSFSLSSLSVSPSDPEALLHSWQTRKPRMKIPIPPPPLLRKRSGEVVKPVLKGNSRSQPTTPTKFVHFGASLEHIKLFKQGERPEVISNPSSDVEDSNSSDEENEPEVETKLRLSIRLPNFPPSIYARTMSDSRPVLVDKIDLSPDENDLRGLIKVQNLSYYKVITIRYTFNYWKSVDETNADYVDSLVRSDHGGIDRFKFRIDLSNRLNRILPNKQSMFFAVKYQVGDQIFWDSNDGMNYRVDFVFDRVKVNKRSPEDRPIGLKKEPNSPDDPTGVPSFRTEKFGSRYNFGPSLKDSFLLDD